MSDDRGADGATDAGDAVDRHVRVSLEPSAVAYITLALLLAAVVFWVFGAATSTITKIAVGAILAIALDPVVSALRRRGWRRLPAATVVGAGLLVAFGLVLAVLGPRAIDEAEKFEDQLPETVQEFYSLPVVGDFLEENDAAGRVQEWVDELPATIDDETVADTVDSLVGSVATALIILAVAFAILLDGEAIVARSRRLLPPSQRERADRIGRTVYSTFGKYFGGSVTVAVLAGLNTLVIGLIFGVPLAPVAAIWTMITNLIPQVGGFLGGAFLAILALSVSVPVAIIVVVLFVLYMNFENNVLQPAIVGKAVDLSPPTTMMAVFVGGAAAGVPGALVATPIVGTVKRLYLSLVRGEEPD